MSVDTTTSIRITPEPLHRLNGPERAAAEGENAWGDDGLGFDDFLDFINPLQHIPIVSTLYRAATGDEISPAARMLGGTLLAGPIGLIAALVSSVIEQETGGDIGDNVLALFTGEDEPQQQQFALASESYGPPNPSYLAPAAAAPVAAMPAAALTVNTTAATLPKTLPTPHSLLPPQLPEVSLTPLPSPPLLNPEEQNTLLKKLGLLNHSLDDVQKQYQKMQTMEEQEKIAIDLLG